MGVVEFVEEVVEPFDGGRTFGLTGPYDLVRGRARIELDPSNRANAAITDLTSANPARPGVVEIRSDVIVLRPVDVERGNGCLLGVVPNRGSTGGLPFTLSAQVALGGDTSVEPGDGWPLRAGWTIAWAGWQWDVGAGLLGCEVPAVVDGSGRPVSGTVRLEIQPFLPQSDVPLRSAASRVDVVSYPSADLAQSDAELRWSDGRGRRQTLVPHNEWRFAREVAGEVVADAGRLWLQGGLRPDRVYELLYRTDACPLVGGGLAAFRDVLAHLRESTPAITHSVAVGWSQSGRFLRELMRCGMNADESGRQVFDAVVPFIAGASRGEFNQRHGLPDEALAAGLGHRPPYAPDGLLERQRIVGGAPKVVLVNSSSEYWRSDGSLAHIDPGGQDLEEPSGTRQYLLAGTEHIGAADLGIPLPGMPRNFLRVTPINRAILELVRRWVVDGVEPPPSAVPRIEDGTAVPRQQVLEALGGDTIAGVPTTDQLPVRHRLDVGPDADRGIPAYPVLRGEPLPAFVSAVDEDGNEVAGIRHPELTVPLATHTGWSDLLAEGTQWEALAVLVGNSRPFPAPVITERYGNRANYLAQVRAAAETLATDRFLLPEDIDVVVETAGDHYDELTATPAGDST